MATKRLTPRGYLLTQRFTYRYGTVCPEHRGGDIVLPAAQAAVSTKVYPNPAAVQLFVELGAEYEAGATLTLRNELGQALSHRVLQAGHQHSAWDVSGLSSGVYFMEVRTADGSREALRFVKAD